MEVLYIHGSDREPPLHVGGEKREDQHGIWIVDPGRRPICPDLLLVSIARDRLADHDDAESADDHDRHVVLLADETDGERDDRSGVGEPFDPTLGADEECFDAAHLYLR